MKIILIMGLPGAGKTTLANELAKLIKAKRLNADEIRKAANDWDFSEEGRKRQAKRMSDAALKLKNEGNNVIADFTGSDLQRDAPINCSQSMTGAVVHYCLAAIIGSDIPVNEGAFRPVTFVMPEASIVAAAPPAPVVGRMAIVHRTCDTVLGAMAQALPNKIPAAYYGMSTTYHLSGVGPDNNMTWALFEIEIGGWGGSCKRDGLETCSAHIHNPANTPVEMVERLHPIRIER